MAVYLTAMRILPVTTAHIPALSGLARDTFVETFGHLYPPQDLTVFLEASYSPEKLAADVADPAQMWRLVFEDDEAVAFLQCGPVNLPHPDADPANEGELKRIYVRQSQQGNGLGKMLLSIAMAWMEETCPDRPQWIGVWNENRKAQGLYASYGFEKVGDYLFPVGQTLDHEFILRRIP
ncbi:MAG: GNAT family N-acetyltransferase [Asticcacaulis sp.]